MAVQGAIAEAIVSPLAAGLHVSVAQIKTYLRCPRQYQLKYVLGVAPAFMPVAFVFGGAFHAALSYFYGIAQATGAPPPLEEVVQVFRDAWANESSARVPVEEDTDEAEGHEAKGAAMLAVFHARAAPAPVMVESVERGFVVDLRDPDTGELLEEQLAGVFDLVVREGLRRIVVEHKTSARRYSEDQLRYDLQPTAYKLAAARLGLGDVGVRFQIVTKTKVPAVQIADLERGASAEDDFMRTVVGVLRAIDAGAFHPVRGWHCRACQFAHACPGGGR